MNVDDAAILRPKNLTLADKLEAVELVLDNLARNWSHQSMFIWYARRIKKLPANGTSLERH
jgi:hypothetical protein